MPRRFDIKPGGSEPGPEGEGMCLFSVAIPGDGARRGGVALPMPESVSSQTSKGGIIHNSFQFTHTHINTQVLYIYTHIHILYITMCVSIDR